MRRKLIAIVVVIVIILVSAGGMYYNLVVKASNSVENESIVYSETYNEIVGRDYVNDYPADYLHLIDENNEIVMYQYGKEMIDAEAEGLITKQRQLFGEQLLELNSFDEQLKGYMNEVNNYHKVDRYIVSRKNLATNVLAYDGSITEVKVEEVFSDGLVFQYNYYLINENGMWKIFSWERGVTRYPIVEETEEK